MLSSVLNLRLEQLEKNIIQVSQLLNDYEQELIDEDDPGKRRRHRRRIEELRQKNNDFEKELQGLQPNSVGEDSVRFQYIYGQLSEIDQKVEFLLDSHAFLNNAILFHFSPQEKQLLSPLTSRLGEADMIWVKDLLAAIDSDQIGQNEIQLILTESQNLFEKLKEKSLISSLESNRVSELIDPPNLDKKHSLKLSIPIIPFLLSYEAELGTGLSINLDVAWQNLKSKFKKN